MSQKEFENWFWEQVNKGFLPGYELDTAAKSWEAARARINWTMNELSITNNLGHWRCASKKSTRWWIRDDGLEATLHISGESIVTQLKNIDSNIPMYVPPTTAELAQNRAAIAKAFNHENK